MTSKNTKYLEHAYIIELLKKLDDELAKRQVTSKLYIVGGANIALEHNYLRATTDIDVVVKFGGDEVFKVAAEVAKSEDGLGDDWLNNEFTGKYNTDGGLSWSWLDNRDSDEPRTLFEGKFLVVELASPEMMLCLKTLAGRDRDLEDIFLLMRELNINTYEGLSKNIHRYTGDRLFQMQGQPGNYIHISQNIQRILNNLPDDMQPSRKSFWQKLLGR